MYLVDEEVSTQETFDYSKGAAQASKVQQLKPDQLGLLCQWF